MHVHAHHSFETARDGACQVLQKMWIHAGARRKIGTERVKNTRCCICAVHHRGDHRRVELRFGKHTVNALAAHTLLNFGNARRAWVRSI